MSATVELPLLATVGVFIVSAAAIALAGSKLSGVADELADRTGMGDGRSAVRWSCNVASRRDHLDNDGGTRSGRAGHRQRTRRTDGSDGIYCVWGIHPVSILIPVAYGFGLKLLSRIRNDPTWKPVQTDETREEISEPDTGEDAETDRSLWLRFLLYAGIGRTKADADG